MAQGKVVQFVGVMYEVDDAQASQLPAPPEPTQLPAPPREFTPVKTALGWFLAPKVDNTLPSGGAHPSQGLPGQQPQPKR